MGTFASAKAHTLKAVQRTLVETARKANAEVMGRDPRPASVTRTVDGMVGASEDMAKRRIVYDYTRTNDAVVFALQFLRDRSPVKSGAYRNAWFAMVDGARVEDVKSISATKTVTITNDEPYSRKINVGHMKMSVPPHLVEDAVQAVNGRFGNQVAATSEQIKLPSGYILKGRFRRGRSVKARKKIAKDTRAGAEMTYPALVIRVR